MNYLWSPQSSEVGRSAGHTFWMTLGPWFSRHHLRTARRPLWKAHLTQGGFQNGERLLNIDHCHSANCVTITTTGNAEQQERRTRRTEIVPRREIS